MPLETSKSTKRSSQELGYFRERCPFYGFRWKENSDELFDQGNNECGLDFDTHGQCTAELVGGSADYQECPLARHYQSLLDSAARFIRFCPANRS
jgi:hypothetical protein